MPLIEISYQKLGELQDWYSTINLTEIDHFTQTGIYPIFDPLNDVFTKLNKLQVNVAKDGYDLSTQRYENTLMLNSIILVASVIVAGILS